MARAALIPIKKRADGSPDYSTDYDETATITKPNNVTGIPSVYKAFRGFNDEELLQAFGEMNEDGQLMSVSNDGFIDNVTFTDIDHLYDGKDLEFYWTIKAAQANAHRATCKIKKEIWENFNNTEDFVRWIIFGTQILAFMNPAMFGMLTNPTLLVLALGWSVAVSPFINRMKNGSADADIKSIQQWNQIANERQVTLGWGSKPMPSSEIAFAQGHKENIKEMWKQGIYDFSKSGVPVTNYASEIITDFFGKYLS
jgi:hypothetical protein